MPTFMLEELARLSGSELHGNGSCVIAGVGSLDDAKPGQIAFLTTERFRQHLANTQASAVIVRSDALDDCPGNALVNENPYLAYALIASALSEREPASPGLHVSAVVEDSAEVADSARIEAQCYVGANVQIGAHVVIGPGCVVGEGCRIGAGSRLVANVTLGEGTEMGERCLVQPGAVIGADGFGMANDQGRWVKVPQLGKVVIGDDVEIGACTTIDRGAIEDTCIEDGVKLDNLIQIAHNVHVGEHTAIAAGVGIAGSTKIGAYCTVAGAVGMAGHIEVADRTHISGLTAVTKSIRKPGIYTSTVPAMPHEQWRKNFSRLKQLDDMAKRLKSLEKSLQAKQAEAKK